MMIRERAQVAVLGAGFAGSLMAMVLRRMGYDVLLIEQGAHPRFAIGESATPLANLALENIARVYDLPRLLPLTEYGSWRAAYPNLTCGLKRGFSFFSHEAGKPFKPGARHFNELLVAASPNDQSADTHWLRSEFDEFITAEARAVGVGYFDQTRIESMVQGPHWTLCGNRLGAAVEFTADFLIDATGPAGALSKHLAIPTEPAGIRTHSRCVYTHWEGVTPWDEMLAGFGADSSDHPYPCDAAALHHIVPGAWMWLLRFDNGITSSGIAFDANAAGFDSTTSPDAQWRKMMDLYPSIKAQFASAVPVRPLVATARMQRRAARVTGPGWAMLPHATYFLDPLLSPGIAHTLIGVERLGRMFRDRPGPSDLQDRLSKYASTLFEEIDFIDQLLSGCYRSFGKPELLHAWLMYYFAAAIHCEKRRREPGWLDSDAGFLLSDDHSFRTQVARAFSELQSLSNGTPSAADFAAFQNRVAADISFINVAGLCDLAKRNIYSFV